MSPTTTGLAGAEVASTTEVARYDKAFRETRRTLDECILRLRVLEQLTESSLRRGQIRQRRAALESDRSNLVRANVAFHTEKATMRPPSPELVETIVAISKEAVELTVEKATAAALVKLATSALNEFAKIQSI